MNEIQENIPEDQETVSFDFDDDNQTVMLAPARGFYSTPGIGLNEVRIAFILDSKKLIRAVSILEKALIAYQKLVS